MRIDQSAVDLALARAVIYRALAIGLQSPTADSLVRLGSDSAKEAIREAAQFLDRARLPTKPLLPVVQLLRDGEISTTDLDAGYTRLFGHTARGLVCPCETEYGPEGGFQQPQQLADLAGYYRAFGLQTRPGSDQRVDHVSCECEFMEFLCCKEAFSGERLQEARETGPRDETLQQTRLAEASFLHDHLGRVGRAFGHQLVKEDEDGFFGHVGHVLLRFLDFECELLGVEAGPASLSVRTGQEDGVPAACGTGESLIQIRRHDDYGCAEQRTE